MHNFQHVNTMSFILVVITEITGVSGFQVQFREFDFYLSGSYFTNKNGSSELHNQ